MNRLEYYRQHIDKCYGRVMEWQEKAQQREAEAKEHRASAEELLAMGYDDLAGNEYELEKLTARLAVKAWEHAEKWLDMAMMWEKQLEYAEAEEADME